MEHVEQWKNFYRNYVLRFFFLNQKLSLYRANFVSSKIEERRRSTWDYCNPMRTLCELRSHRPHEAGTKKLTIR